MAKKSTVQNLQPDSENVIPLQEEFVVANDKYTSEIKNTKEISKDCEVIIINKNTITVKFDDYLLSIKTDTNNIKTGDFVTVKYQSYIGKPDFRYHI